MNTRSGTKRSSRNATIDRLSVSSGLSSTSSGVVVRTPVTAGGPEVVEVDLQVQTCNAEAGHSSRSMHRSLCPIERVGEMTACLLTATTDYRADAAMKVMFCMA